MSKNLINQLILNNNLNFFRYSGSLDYSNNKIQLETDLNFSKTKGTGSGKIQLPNQQPIGGDFKFNCNHKDSGDLTTTITYGDGKRFTTTLRGQMPDEQSLILATSIQGNAETFREFTFNLDAKQPAANEIVSKINGKLDGKPYSLDYEHRASPQNPRVNFAFTCPQGQTSKFNLDAEIVSALKGKGNILIENFKDFNLDGNVDADLSTLENFYFRGDVNCPLLEIRKYAFDIHARDAGGRTGVEYKITREGSHVLSGTSDFTTKTDKGRTIIEGKSTFKLTDGKSDDVTFKVIRNVFERERDGETGFGGTVTVNVGPRQYVGDLKLTDKEFHSKYSGCAKKGSCTNFETRSVMERANLNGFRHNLEVLVDMRQVGAPHQFTLKSDTSRDGIKFLHSMDAALQSGNSPDYKYSTYINEKNAGTSFTMPRREIALEATYNYPERFYGKYDTTISFFIDKRKPQLKSEIGFTGEVSHAGNTGMKANAEVKFTHPRVNPLAIRGNFEIDSNRMDMNSNLEFDVFTNPNDKIVFNGKFGNSDASGRGFNITNEIELFSRGLDFKVKLHEHTGLSFERRLVTYGSEITLPVENWRFGVHAFASEKNFEIIGVAFNEEMLKTNAVYDLAKNDLSLESSVK